MEEKFQRTIDELIRHSITKLSYHFVGTKNLKEEFCRW